MAIVKSLSQMGF